LHCGIAILGSTGSIGTSALDVIERLSEPYRIVALSGNRQTELLSRQIRKHRPAAVAVGSEESVTAVREAAVEVGAQLYVGIDGMCEMVARNDVTTVLSALVGAAGLRPTLRAVEAGKRVALANKESLVVGGSIIVPAAQKSGAMLLPVDSEHSAVFQAMQCGRLCEVRRVILTASGGPFRTWDADRIRNATPDDALRHPTWNMGSKITIDSATLFNKALEVIEAVWLFDLPPEKVEVVIHPESVIHSMVEFVDGSVIAQLSPPDMRTPIQYALTYPERMPGIAPILETSRAFSLNFEPPDPNRFPALRMGFEVAKRGGTLGAVFNAANEVAVAAFLSGKIRFGEIWEVVEHTMSKHTIEVTPTLSTLLDADEWARSCATEWLEL
jgi:1-deoxy-D-xylulose-5-phosphate reductoisomerase